MPKLLEVSRLTVGYGHVGVLEDVSLAVEAEAIVALVGSNGAGKSTLMRAISGLLRPAAGSISFAGTEIAGKRPDLIVSAGLLHVAEGRRLFRTQSVGDNLQLGCYGATLSAAERKRRYERVFALFPILAERREQLAGALSGGQQQMLAIGQAMMRDPKLLMLDEPSLGLAPILVDQVLEAVVTLRREGTAILLVEQMVERALEVADRAYVMQNGRILAEGDAAEIARSDVLHSAYMGKGEALAH